MWREVAFGIGYARDCVVSRAVRAQHAAPLRANVIDNSVLGEVYNAGGREEWGHEIKHISDLILKSAGRDDSQVTYRGPDPFAAGVNHMDFSKASPDPGHDFRIPLENGIPCTMAWMSKAYGL